MFTTFIAVFAGVLLANIVYYVFTLAVACSPKMYGWIANKTIDNICKTVETRIDDKYSA